MRDNRIGVLRRMGEHDEYVMVEQRRRSDYDAALGTGLGEGVRVCHNHHQTANKSTEVSSSNGRFPPASLTLGSPTEE